MTGITIAGMFIAAGPTLLAAATLLGIATTVRNDVDTPIPVPSPISVLKTAENLIGSVSEGDSLGAFTAGVDAGSTAVTVAQQAAKLSHDLRRNGNDRTRVTIQTNNETVDIDLKGKSHYDKKTETNVPTPHVKTTPKNPDGRPNVKGRTVRPATTDDIRNARNAAKRQPK
jgi:hypothetical protein